MTNLLMGLKMQVAEMKHLLRGAITYAFFCFPRNCLVITFGATLHSVDQVLHI